MSMLAKCQSRAEQLGVLDRTVLFLKGWIPYEERQEYLLDSDIGVSAHPDTVESRLSFRTRILDYLWAGLPAIVSQGDSLAELIEREALGLAVPPGDAAGWQSAIVALADDKIRRAAMKQRALEVARRFHWSVVAKPLVEYCNQPHRSAPAARFRKFLTPMLTKLYESL